VSNALSRRTALALAAILAFGLAVRSVGLADHTLSQAESFNPGIPYPAYAVVPTERTNAIETLRSTIWHDVHPPAYYLLMLGWAKAFGVELGVMRLPSVAIGLASLAALFAFARREHGDRVALISTALLAANGLHIHFSQRARIWVLAYLVAIVATWLLVRLERSSSRGLRAAYFATSTLGLWTSYAFWPFFIGHGVYALLGRFPLARAREALRLQACALIASSVLVVVLRSQLRHAHDIAEAVWVPLLRVFALNGLVDDVALLAFHPPLGEIAFAAAAIAGFALLALGSRSRNRIVESGAVDVSADGPALAGVVGVVALLALAAAELVGLRALGVQSAQRLAVGAAFALAVALAWIALAWTWPRVVPLVRSLRRAPVVAAICGDVSTALVATTTIVLLAASLAIKPMLVARSLFMVGPFCMVLVARGVASLPRRLAIGCGIALAAIGLLSVRHAHGSLYANPIGYGPVAAAVTPHLREGDGLAIGATWFAQPLFFYFDHRRFDSRPPEKWLEAFESGDESARQLDRLWLFAWGRKEVIEASVAEAVAPFAAHGFAVAERYDELAVSGLLLARSPVR